MAGGSPNNAAAIGGYVQGLRGAKARFAALPKIVQDARNEVNEFTAKGVVNQARLRLAASPSIGTRSLYNAVEYRVTKSNGTARVGVTNGQTTMTVAGRTLKVKGIVVAGTGGSALASQGARVIRPAFYAWFVERGTARMKAEPFMGPAAAVMREGQIRRWHLAGSSIERKMAGPSPGGGGLL